MPQGKNLVGAFHPPSLVLADPDVLASLPAVELRNGLAEVIGGPATPAVGFAIGLERVRLLAPEAAELLLR